jgi:hypothetical protein
MDKQENFLTKRIQDDLYVPQFTYLYGLLDIIQFLCIDLKKLLEDEGRYFGIMPIYIKRIERFFEIINKDDTSDDLNKYARILYLFKPLINREYKKLRQRKVTRADCVIVIVKKILEIVLEDSDFPSYKEVKKIYKIFVKLFNNIKNSGKNYSLFKLSENMKKYLNSGQVGKYVILQYSIINEENRIVKSKELLTKPDVKIEETKELKKINL